MARKSRIPPSQRPENRKSRKRYRYLQGPNTVILSVPAVAQLCANVLGLINNLDKDNYTVFVFFRRYPKAEARYQRLAAAGIYRTSGCAQSNPKIEPVVFVALPRHPVNDGLPLPPETPVVLIGDSDSFPYYTINELLEFVAENDPHVILGPESLNALRSS